jgi:hypothetical protein
VGATTKVTKDSKVTKVEYEELSNYMIGCAIAVHWHLGPERKDRIERVSL